MRIIIKFALRNIAEKKFRTFLMVFAIMVSSALFFASGAISGTIESMYIQRMSEYFGSARILVHANEKSPSPYVSSTLAKELSNKLDYAIGVSEGSGILRVSRDLHGRVQLFGVDYSDLQRMNPAVLSQERNLMPFSGRKILISHNAANKYGKHIGDAMEIEINGTLQRFSIVGIALPGGLFRENDQSIHVVIPKETMNSFYGIKGLSTSLYLKPADGQDQKQLILSLSQIYKKHTVRETIAEADVQRQAQNVTTPFMLMVTIVMFISIFIIYTSFRVITIERLPVIGTFRSIGATRKMTDIVLMAESLMYGILGGALGCALGIGILYIMSLNMISPWDRGIGIRPSIYFTPAQLVTAFLLAVALSLISSAIPIIKISKIPVRDIVLNSIERGGKKSHWKLYAGTLMLTAILIIPPFIPKSLALFVNMGFLIFAAIAVIFLIPYITNAFLLLFERLYSITFGNEGILAAKNLRENKNILNNIALLAIGISAMLMINTISGSVFKEVLNVYRDLSFELEVWGSGVNRNTEQLLKRIEGVEDTYGIYRMRRVEIVGAKDSISAIESVDKTKHQRYFSYTMEGDPVRLLEELDSQRSIMITTTLKEKFKLNQGDYLALKTRTGVKNYKIIGFFNSIMRNGNYALMSERYLKADGGIRNYTYIVIRTSKDPDAVMDRIKSQLGPKGIEGMTVAEEEKLNNESNAQMFNILKGFSIMTLVIGIFGVLNNFTISFLERKRFIAMMCAVGMSKAQTVKMIFIEAVTGGLIGGVVGVFTGLVMISVVPHVMKAVDLPVPIHISIAILLISILSGMLITLIASVSPALKNSRLNLIEAIKYE